MPAPDDDLAQSMMAAWNAGQSDRVIALARDAQAPAAESELVLALLGLAYQQAHRHGDAAEALLRLTRLRPDVSQYWNNLGVAFRQAGDLAASEQALRKAQALAPGDAEVHYNLGLLYIQQQRWAAARDVLLDAVRLAPQFIEARLEAAHACHVCGNIEGEEAMLEGAGDWPPQPAEQALVLASILSVLGRLDTALNVLARARLPEGPAAEPMRLRFTAQRVALYERNNLRERARGELDQLPLEALDALPPDADQVRIDGWQAHAVVALREARYTDAATLYQRVLDAASDDGIRASGAFGLAAAHDRQARYRDAWQALAIAHAAQLRVAQQASPERLDPDGGQPLPMAARSVDAAARAAWKPLEYPATPASPVFVIGFPRSGTTMLEQMLDAHPDFRSMDERGFVYQLIERMEHAGQRYPDDLAELSQDDADQLRAVYWRLVHDTLPDLGRRRLVDKNPLNMLCLPLILRLFPDARIILCLRHPCDVLLSCYMQAFRSPAFMVMCSTLPRLARGYAVAFEQCSAHLEVFRPHVHEWRYEAAVDDPAGEVTRLGGFLGLDDASPMLDFAGHAQRKGFIATPSYARVTAPVDRKSVGRWHAYREHFEPVLPVLRPWIERFGYGV
ncbi:MAG TPA: sulfotransferase [Rhodanobacteraceae bacterium]|nr:sulfotransferase [Rhodanobacteraceae bacterium]